MEEKSLCQCLYIIQINLKAPKNLFNKFGNYSYRSAENILDAVKQCIKDHELRCMIILQDEILHIGDRYYIKSTAKLKMDNNEIIVTALAREEETKKGMDGAQITGAASSYARKYALNGLFAIDDTKDMDFMDNSQKKEIKKTCAEPGCKYSQLTNKLYCFTHKEKEPKPSYTIKDKIMEEKDFDFSETVKVDCDNAT